MFCKDFLCLLLVKIAQNIAYTVNICISEGNFIKKLIRFLNACANTPTVKLSFILSNNHVIIPIKIRFQELIVNARYFHLLDLSKIHNILLFVFCNNATTILSQKHICFLSQLCKVFTILFHFW